MQNIIYETPEGLAIVTPSQEALSIYGIMAIALKDVPSGVPFKIVENGSMDMSNPDGVGAVSNEFPEER